VFEVRCVESAAVRRRGHPSSSPRSNPTELLPKRAQLGCSTQAATHQLHFIADPEAIFVEESEMHRQPVPAHRVAAIKRAAEQHFLSADYDSRPLWVKFPIFFAMASYQGIDLQTGADL
jgi:hypothetical protein